MATPSPKSPALENFLEHTFGRTTAIAEATCVYCRGEAVLFTDALSLKEYTISGLCQDCQDAVFGEDE